jgi:nicotinamide mononucleotide adenylyltransferase
MIQLFLRNSRLIYTRVCIPQVFSVGSAKLWISKYAEEARDGFEARAWSQALATLISAEP